MDLGFTCTDTIYKYKLHHDQIWRLQQQTSTRPTTYHQARHNGNDIGDGVHHGPGLRVHVDVPEHSAVHQCSKKKVDMAHQHQPQPHLHQGFVVLEAGTAYS